MTAIARNLGRGRSAINKVVKDEGLRERGVRDDAPPDALIRPHVDWSRKAVLALANRSVLDGYTAKDAEVADERVPTLVGVYEPGCVIELRADGGRWVAS